MINLCVVNCQATMNEFIDQARERLLTNEQLQ